MGDSLRDRQQAATRASIIDAFLDLAHAENAVGISVPAVADRAGVSVRTVYRYFATKDDLQTAAANYYNDRAERSLNSRGLDPSSFRQYLLTLWTDFAEELPAVMAEHATPAGRRLRATRLPGSREMVRASLPDGADDELVDSIIALTSSSMFLELVDRIGHSPERAVSMALRMVRHLVAGVAADESRANNTKPDVGANR